MSGGKGLTGRITPPPDKSISHRAVMFSALAKGTSMIRNFLQAGDTLSTAEALRMLGIRITAGPRDVVVEGKGLDGLREPGDIINCGNSGTTMRLLAGLLSGNPFFSVLTGDASLRQRPMARVIVPLKEMGASVAARGGDRYPPLAIRGGGLRGLEYVMPVASAQVKSSLMLAGLYARGHTVIAEPFRSRDHSERMLASMGAPIRVSGLTITVAGHGDAGGGRDLDPLDMVVPGDFSSAAFFIGGGCIIPGSDVHVEGVGVNPTRTGFLVVLKEMGAAVELLNPREVSGEPVADVRCRCRGSLRAVRVGGGQIPALIDEFPILCVVATQAEGVTEIRGAQELRVKESDRIDTIVKELRKMGAQVEEFADGVAIEGPTPLQGAVLDSHGDHRIAMSLSIAGCLAEGGSDIRGEECVAISYPGFFGALQRLRGGG